MSKIIIQGCGTVGLATERFLRFHVDKASIEFHDPAKDLRTDSWTDADWCIICVPTPLSNHSPYTLDIEAVIDAVVTAQNHGFLGTFVMRSTLPLDHMSVFDWLGDRLLIWPEFIRAQHWEEDAVRPRMILLGGGRTHEFARLLGPVPGAEKIHVSPRQAVLVKLATNAFLATKVTFANQIHDLCQYHGLDYGKVQQALAQEGRLGSTHWQVPGPDGLFGFGGACLPKDTVSLMSDLAVAGIETRFFESMLDFNERRRNERSL